MLGLQLRRLGRILIPLAIGAWGLFALVIAGQYGGHLDNIPRELWLFGLVLGGAVTASAIAWLWLRARRPDDSRW
jgi:predicted benzoate:H+ symporter BenE